MAKKCRPSAIDVVKCYRLLMVAENAHRQALRDYENIMHAFRVAGGNPDAEPMFDRVNAILSSVKPESER